MRQFDVLQNTDSATAPWAPYLVVLQHDLLQDLATVVVAPMVREEAFGRPVTILNPVFTVQDAPVVLSIAELAGVSRTSLGDKVGSLAEHRSDILAALDLLFTGV
jgi:toxin CcdB